MIVALPRIVAGGPFRVVATGLFQVSGCPVWAEERLARFASAGHRAKQSSQVGGPTGRLG